MNKKTELVKIGRAYFAIILSIICITGIACGAIMARNNTRALSIGEHEARLALSHREQSLSLTVQEKDLEIKTDATEKLMQIARFTPAPLSNFFWIAECIVEIVKS